MKVQATGSSLEMCEHSKSMEVVFRVAQSGGDGRRERQIRPPVGGVSKHFSVKCQKLNVFSFSGPYGL